MTKNVLRHRDYSSMEKRATVCFKSLLTHEREERKGRETFADREGINNTKLQRSVRYYFIIECMINSYKLTHFPRTYECFYVSKFTLIDLDSLTVFLVMLNGAASSSVASR